MLVPIIFFCPLTAVIVQMDVNNMFLQSLDKTSEFFRITSTGEVCMSYIKSSLKVIRIHKFNSLGKFFCFTAKV
ncbi:hypothetical protein SDC9_157760 [bioreactor metagenome]|uniref:Uncharacterized protein n=1 Tax=bioreactor metagenome TaxID=1076179 RepID=A0A645F7X0_9ZZZZ